MQSSALVPVSNAPSICHVPAKRPWAQRFLLKIRATEFTFVCCQ